MNAESTFKLFQASELFSCFSERDLQDLLTSATVATHELSDEILTQGAEATTLFMVSSGKVRLFTTENDKVLNLDVLEVGDLFGEIALLPDKKYNYSVRSSGKTEIVSIPISAVQAIVQRIPDYNNYIKQYLILKLTGGLVSKLFDLRKKADRKDIEQAVRSVGVKRFPPGKVILNQDATEDQRLYVIREGEVTLTREEEGNRYLLQSLAAGEVFGEKSVLNFSPQPCEVKAVTDVTALVIPEKTVHFIIDHNPGIKEIFEERIHFLDKDLERQQKIASWKPQLPRFSQPEKIGFKAKVIKRFEFVEQAEEMDCGAACLAMICKHYKIPLSLGKLRELANVTTEGASMDSLARAGESIGFTTKGVRSTFGTLSSFQLPFIAHWQGYHYVVVYGISKKYVWIADPAEGFKKFSRSEFEHGWTGNSLLFTRDTEKPAKDLAKPTPWKRFLSYLLPHKRILRDLFIGALIIQLFGIVTPIIIQNILDRVVVHQNISLLNMMMIGLIVITIFAQLTEYLSVYLSLFMTRKMDFDMMSKFCLHVFSLPIDFFAKRKTGDIVARFQENETVRQFMTDSSISVILNAMMSMVYIIVMFQYNIKLTCIVLALIIPLILVTLLATPKYKKFARQVFYSETEAESHLLESLNGAESIKAMAVERIVRKKWESKYTASLKVRYRSEIFTATIGIISQLLKAVISLTILFLGAHLVIEQKLTIGQFMAYNALVGAALTPILGLVGIWDEFQESLVSIERLNDVYDLSQEQPADELSSRVILADLEGNISCKNVNFRYGGENSPLILDNINMTIEKGQTVALVGHSGSGKTTLAKLLVGLYLPSKGSITVDGYDLTTLDFEYYRKRIGYVMQNNLLFAGSIADNIAMGESDYDHRRVVEVAKLADAHGFISNMPLGYEQVIGEQGTGMSGGQIQRICIARALYRDPGFLILDEATSALDTESENQIQQNLNKILVDRTAVVIAHRLSTIQQADNIFVLYNGSIAEEGTHDELIARKGMYFHLVKKQLSSTGQTA